MNKLNLIRKQAEKFSYTIRNLEDDPRGESAIEFKNELASEIYNYYEDEDKLIYLYEIANEIELAYKLHLKKCTAKEDPHSCKTNLYYETIKYFLEQEISILNPNDGFKIFRPHVDQSLISYNLKHFNSFPASLELYSRAINNLNQGGVNRHIIDDLRLSLELLIREFLGNKKSLENQIGELGKIFKENEISKEAINMFLKLIDYFSKYQNENVKHGENINKKEIDFLINLTSTFIKLILQNDSEYVE